jgi:hypothetical protein
VDTIDIETLAAHEAGHALMRWLLRGHATETWIDSHDFEGASEPVEERVAFHLPSILLITLAGIAVENRYCFIGSIDWDSSSADDIDRSRDYIKAFWPKLCAKYKTENECLDAVLLRASSILLPHRDLIQEITEHLVVKQTVRASELEELCSEHGVRPMTRIELSKAAPSELVPVD